MKLLKFLIFSNLLCFYLAEAAHAQNSPYQNFKFTKHVTKKDIQHDKILVKLKSEFVTKDAKEIIAEVRKKLQDAEFKPLLTENAQKKLAARARPLRSPIERIYEIELPPGSDIEKAIDLAYSTGYFEVVEPAFIYNSYATPNDEKFAQQYYLPMIKVPQAWTIHSGGEELLIAIVDSGIDFNHPDLKDKIYFNEDDPVDGIDNDNDGYVDNYAGWDFVGSHHNNPIPDNDPGIYAGNINHGTLVAGLAAASSNNHIGIAGVSRGGKLLITKHAGDDKPAGLRSVVDGYEGLIYAVNHGADIINCSWGGPYYSHIAKDIIDFAVEDMNVVVVAAAGNDNSNQPIYPAAFDNVLSVTALDRSGTLAPFANTGPFVNVAVPGTDLISTDFEGKYRNVNGTSFATALASGAAALVRSRFPMLTARQVIELLRVSANDSIYDNPNNPPRQSGKGLLDVEAALSKKYPSLRMNELTIVNKDGNVARAGDTAYVYANFTNYLWRSSSMLKARMTVSNPHIQMIAPKVPLGRVGLMGTTNNIKLPFVFYMDENIDTNTEVEIIFEFSDGDYRDFQLFNVRVNPGFIDITENMLALSLAENGRIGYYDFLSHKMGRGLVVNKKNTLFEMGLIMGTGPDKVINNVRRLTDSADWDFTVTGKMQQARPGKYAAYEITGQLSDDNAGSAKLGLSMDYRFMIWEEAPLDNCAIIEYKIRNNSTVDINDFFMGMFADWDVSPQGQKDQLEYLPEHQLAYMWNDNSEEKILAGVQALTSPAGVFSSKSTMLYDGFSDDEKFTGISTHQHEAVAPGDVFQISWQGPFDIAAGKDVTIAFALHGTTSFLGLRNSAIHADSVYNFTLKAKVPQVQPDTICYGGNAQLIASDATKYHWYNSFFGGEKVAEGPVLSISNIKSDTTFYVANAEQHYESVRVAASIVVRANPVIEVIGDTEFCEGDSVVLQVNAADKYLWSNGATSQSVVVKAADSYSVMVTDNQLNCQQSSEKAVVTSTLPNATAAFAINSENIFKDQDIIFANQSTDAHKYFWEFGDGISSLLAEPVHQYSLNSEYQVKLTAVHENGCSHSTYKILEVVTSAPQLIRGSIKVYPNPVVQDEVFINLPQAFGQQVNIQIISGLGQRLAELTFQNTETIRLDLSAFREDNLLILRIYNQYYQASFKILK